MRGNRVLIVTSLALGVAIFGSGQAWSASPPTPPPPVNADMIVLGFNDLGMHCMNPDFSEFMILPPYNTLHAQVILRKTLRPTIVTSGVAVGYRFFGNTHSADKVNFWDYVGALLGMDLAPDVGLSGHGLSGLMEPGSAGDWVVTGIPLTPVEDRGRENPFQLATITVTNAGAEAARSHVVAPVSWELRCDFCHNGMDAPASVLDAHDDPKLGHGTDLANNQPVLCGGCHGQPELGLPGAEGFATLSRAIHRAHSGRMYDVLDALGGNECYACHPGPATMCLRDVHATSAANPLVCVDCHAAGARDPQVAMLALADENRSPWATEPRCGDPACHARAGHEYEQPNTLYRNSRGHGGVLCAGCHGSPHAVAPSGEDADNVQAVGLQGHPGTIECAVCHKITPPQAFEHRWKPATH